MKIVVVQRGVNRHWPVFPQSYRPPCAPFSAPSQTNVMMPKGRINARIFHLTQKWQAICWRGAKAQPFLITFVFELWKYLFHLFAQQLQRRFGFLGAQPPNSTTLRNVPLVHGGGHEFACGQHHGIAGFCVGFLNTM